MVPHAPLLLAEVAGPKNAARTAAVAAEVAALDLSGVDAVVIASPHGNAPGVYAAPAGDLRGFGARPAVEARGDEALARDLAHAWGQPVLDEPADYGVVVPLLLLNVDAPVVAVAVDEGAALARALARSAGDRRLAFVASANLSAGLGERAPVPCVEGAAAADAAVLEALRRDPSALTRQRAELERAASCGAAPLGAFGTLCAGRSCDVRAYDHPFGVGYAVAITR